MKDVNDEALRKYLESTREEPVQDESLDVADSTAIEEAASGDYAFEPANFEQPEAIEPEYRQEAPDEYSQRLRQYKRDIIEERERDLDAARQSEDNKVMQWVEAIGNISKQGTDRQQTDVFLGNTKDKRVDKAQKDMVGSINDYKKFEKEAAAKGIKLSRSEEGKDLVYRNPLTGEEVKRIKGVVQEKKGTKARLIRSTHGNDVIFSDPYSGEEIKRIKDGVLLSDSQLKDQELRISDNKRKNKSEDRRGDQFEYRKGEDDTKRNERFIENFNKSDVVKGSNKIVSASRAARKIITEGGKMAPATMGRLLARMAGEVGAMTDKDVASFNGSQQWLDSLDRFFTKGMSGNLTETDKKEMINLIDRLEEASQDAVVGYADTVSQQYARANNSNDKELYNILLPKGKYRFALPSNKSPQKTKQPKKKRYSVGDIVNIKGKGKVRITNAETGEYEKIGSKE